MAVSDLPSAHALLGRFAQRSTERHPHASLHSCLFLCSNWWWYWDSSRLHFRPPFKEARVVQISGCGTSTPRCEPREIAIHYLIHCTKNAKRLRVNVRIQVMMHELKEREREETTRDLLVATSNFQPYHYLSDLLLQNQTFRINLGMYDRRHP